MMSRVKENQPSTMALVPTPDLTAPLPKSWAMTLAATDAVCCHSTETSTKMEAMKMMARATCDTGRLGKGLTSRSEPKEPSSSCQPGKVARRRKQMKAKMMAMILGGERVSGQLDCSFSARCLFSSFSRTKPKEWEGEKQNGENVHEIWEHDHILELARQPDEVERVLVDAHLLGQGGSVVGAEPGAAVRVDADAKVAHAGLELGVAGDALDLRVGGVVDLSGVGVRRVVVIVEGEEEDVWYQGAG